MNVFTPFRPARQRAWILAIPIAALVLGGAAAFASRTSTPSISALGAPAAGASELAQLVPNDAPASATRSAAGITVQFQQAAKDETHTVVYYKVQSEAGSAFAQMLGIPRLVNLDGSFVLPSEYGSTGPAASAEAGVPGLPAGSAAAIFDSVSIQPGAVMRFGPFFRALPEGDEVRTTGSELVAGHSQRIGGENFTVSAVSNSDGTTSVNFVNLDPNATVVFSHPASNVRVTEDGKDLQVIHGSTNFAKTEALDVNANRSSVSVAGQLRPGSVIVITTSSIGSVLHGSWDFPLN